MPRLLLSFLLAGTLLVPGFTKAETEPVDCFDYYTFNSVQVDVSSTVSTTVPGISLTLSGEIRNENSYPVTDGSVFVKIFRKDVNGEIQRNGYPLIGSFFAKEDVVIPANDRIPFSFQWDVPHYLPSGDYEVHFFFLVGKKYNLLGLSFTDDVTGNKAAFSVVSDMPEAPAFDKDSVTLNNASYSFAAYPPRFGRDETVTAEAILANPSNQSRTVEIVWTLHNWSAEQEDPLLDTKSEVVTLEAGQSETVSYEAGPSLSTGSVTVLRAEATYEDTKSILGIRFVRDGFDEIRLNYPGLMKYPVTEGEENILFSCLHATKKGSVDGAKLMLTLMDEFGTVLDTHTYEGSVSGAMMATKHDFVSRISSSTFTLSATLLKDGQTVETYETTYDCEDIDPSLCSMNTEPSPVAAAKEALSTSAGARVLFALFILVPLGLIIWLLSKRGKGGIASLALLLALGSFVAAEGVGAKSVVWSENNIGQICFRKADTKEKDRDTYFRIIDTTADVTYSATARNIETGALLEGSGENIAVGTQLFFEPTERENTDVNWFGTGDVMDSPYGYWRTEASIPPDDQICSRNNCILGDCTRWYDRERDRFYVALSVRPPDIRFEHSGSAQLSCSADGSLCTVESEGDIESSVIFSPTYWAFYHKRFDDESGHCSSEYCCGYSLPGLLVGRGECPDDDDDDDDRGRGESSNSDTDRLSIPEQRVAFSFEVVASSAPPADPVITGSVTGMTNTSYDFSLVSTDEDGDGIRYGIDWTPDDGVDEPNQWLPAVGYAESGLAQMIKDRLWVVPGTYSFRAFALDETGARSSWTTHTITISDPESNLTLCIEGGHGSGTYALPRGKSRSLSAFYGEDEGCTETVTRTNVTGETTFSSVERSDYIGVDNDADEVSGENEGGPETLQANCVSATCDDGASATRSMLVVGSAPPDNPEDPEESGPDTNWREVAPGE